MTEITNELPVLPQDLYSHLRDMDQRSHSFQEDFKALNMLAYETGHRVLTLEMIAPPVSLDAPQGFESNTAFPYGGQIPTKQFEGIIHSVATSDEELTVDVQQLVTDTGKTVRYCDLRGLMTNGVRKGGPETPRGREALDRVVFRDIKFFAETGHAKLSVHGVKGVHYTRLGDTKARAYWMPVKDEGSTEKGVVTIARIADSSDSIAAEADLYRRVFQKKL